MKKTCHQCSGEFEITKDDLAFYEKVSPTFGGKQYDIPPPTLCPDCRRQTRQSFRNERNLYHRKCDKTGRQIISIYANDKNVVVYDHEIWWQDDWDQLSSGQSLNLKNSFFGQLSDLWQKAPRPSIHVIGNENCNYVNQCGYSKNCYLSYNTDWCEDCYYCENVIRSKNCVDLIQCEYCELCYESVDLKACTHVRWSANCQDCHDVSFSRDLRSCSNCFGCIGLRHKQYCLFNEQLTKEKYENTMKEFQFGSHKQTLLAQQKSIDIYLKHPHRNLEMENCEDSLGNFLLNCKRVQHCFDSFDNEDIAYCTVTSRCKDSRDFDVGGYESELCLEMISSGYKVYKCAFGSNHWNANENTYYCELVVNCSHCFGCIGIRGKKYCILNKQYSKEEYGVLVPQIIEQMSSTGKWGQFFPNELSPFGYNETVANDYFPLSKKDCLDSGYRWYDDKETEKYMGPPVAIPDEISEISDDITQKILLCEATDQPYKIIPQELAFYRNLDIPLPRVCPDHRHRDRMARRNPRKLWKRTCAKCNKDIQTTYAPERPEIVYCEECYLSTVY